MKTTILTLTALFITLTVFAQQTEQETVPQQEPVQLTSQADSLQYALGAYLGQWMVNNNFKVQNANLFLRGMDDALKNRPLAVEDSVLLRWWLHINWQHKTSVTGKWKNSCSSRSKEKPE